jgi:Zn-dependent protease with chaperone function
MNDYLAQRAFSRKLEEEADALGLEVRGLLEHCISFV